MIGCLMEMELRMVSWSTKRWDFGELSDFIHAWKSIGFASSERTTFFFWKLVWKNNFIDVAYAIRPVKVKERDVESRESNRRPRSPFRSWHSSSSSSAHSSAHGSCAQECCRVKRRSKSISGGGTLLLPPGTEEGAGGRRPEQAPMRGQKEEARGHDAKNRGSFAYIRIAIPSRDPK